MNILFAPPIGRFKAIKFHKQMLHEVYTPRIELKVSMSNNYLRCTIYKNPMRPASYRNGQMNQPLGSIHFGTI